MFISYGIRCNEMTNWEKKQDGGRVFVSQRKISITAPELTHRNELYLTKLMVKVGEIVGE